MCINKETINSAIEAWAEEEVKFRELSSNGSMYRASESRGDWKHMTERVERLDRSMDVILLFLSIISAAIFQYVTALPYNPEIEAQVAAFAFFMRFSLKLLFLPFLFIIPAWLLVRLARSESWRMLLRIFVWNLSTLSMALNAIILLVIGLPLEFDVWAFPGIILACIIVFVPFGLAGLLQKTVVRSYEKALIMDVREPAQDYFFDRYWRIAAQTVVPVSCFLIWSMILLLAF